MLDIAKNADSTSRRSVAHATDSTRNGWSENKSAAVAAPSVTRSSRPSRPRPLAIAKEPARDGVHQHRVRRVEEKARQVIAERVHPPQRVVEAQRHPRQRDVVPHVERRPHPVELGRPQAAEVRVVEEVLVVVEAHEPVVERGQECDERHGRDREWDDPLPRRARRRPARRHAPGRRLQTTIVPQNVEFWCSPARTARASSTRRGTIRCPRCCCAGIRSSSMFGTRWPSSQSVRRDSRGG